MRRKYMIISFLLCLLLLLSACIGHVPEVLRTSSETGTSSEKTKPETTAETDPETTEPETTAETEAKTTEPETTSEEETDTEAASSEETESETASETEPETTESETEMKSSETEAESSSEEEEQEDPLVGCWIGEEGSVIVLRNDYSALYCEPYNDNRPELRAGIECSWDRSVGYPVLSGPDLDYSLYMQPSGENRAFRVYADDERWNPELFRLRAGLSEEDARAGFRSAPNEILYVIKDADAVQKFIEKNGLELLPVQADTDLYGILDPDDPEGQSLMHIGQFTSEPGFYASCDGVCDIVLCGIKVGDRAETLEDVVGLYGKITKTERFNMAGFPALKIRLDADDSDSYILEYSMDGDVIHSWYVY